MFAEILQLDTRSTMRESALTRLRQAITIGLEVTDAELATACAAGNIDPQHLGTRGDLSAIEVVTALLKGKAQAATVAPDLDSLGSMAVLEIAMDLIQRARALEGEILKRIELIGAADRFERGGWPGIRPLPTKENAWFETSAASESRPLAAIAAVVKDHTLPLKERVRLLKIWLATGEEPAAYRERVEIERLNMITALGQGDINITEVISAHLATVVSTHRAGIGLGYHRAPVVIALNPAFQIKGGEPHAKFTVAQFTEDYVDLQTVMLRLNELEAAARNLELAELKNRWGGSPAIIGSPQGENSELSLAEVTTVVQSHLH